MKLLSALLIDNIVKHPDGRVDLMGLFEAIYFDRVPFTLESISLFAEVEFEDSERGKKHLLEIVVTGSLNGIIHTAPSISFTAPPISDYPRNVAQLDLALLRVPFANWGVYQVHIRLNGAELRVLPIEIVASDS